MKIKNITIKNFRCFEQLEVTFHSQMTVLIAANGGGKTSILDAVRIAVWPFVKGFDLGSQTGKSATIQTGDVRLEKHINGNMEPKPKTEVNTTGVWDSTSQVKTWLQWRDSIKKGTNSKGDTSTVELTNQYAKSMQKKVFEGKEQIDLPLIAYLGTGRLWYQSRYSSEAADVVLSKTEHSRTSGYLNCLSQGSSFKHFVDWYGWVYRSYREEQIKALEKGYSWGEPGSHFLQTIKAIQFAVNCLIEKQTGWKDIAYSSSHEQQIVLTHPQHGTLPLERLSDGLRNMVAMVADLAYRCVKLNPHLGAEATIKTHGIVMIDEVDMFLHPSWQQSVIGSLQEAFPKIQFIVTTHSPQVLSTVPKECIRVLGTNAEGENIAAMPLADSYGEPSNDVLQAIMQVDPQPPVPEKRLLDELTSLVDQCEYQSSRATELLANLKQKLSNQHPQILKIERSIRRQEAFKA
ncbi:MAG: AAA family ATPase [Pseudomonadales bacterium]|nr:AAA family ATPase [Pseudomonadales bacterium]